MSESEEDEFDGKVSNAFASKVYDDIIGPSAKELGRGLTVVAKTVNIALEPINAFVWGYAQIREHLIQRLSEKLKDTPSEEIKSPDAHVAVPAVEALRYCSEFKELRDLFTNLLASSMTKKNSEVVHPAFVEVIKQLAVDEAIIINYLGSLPMDKPISTAVVTIKTSVEENIREELVDMFAHELRHLHLSRPGNIGTYFENLIRLGVLYIHSDYKDDMADRLPRLGIDLDNFREIFDMRRERTDTLLLSDFGKHLLKSCTE